ncbi:MAG: AAA family ATPase [Clostridiales bacterium]|nr:AAA family ATPase [Clostridiales bacterium]
MKLLSCHIENFGKLSNRDYTFDKNLTVFAEENGAGKTTLAAFIKAMFYGLSSFTAATKKFSDRQRYYPFGGGKFGGNITFEKGGDTYRIERFFDKKSDTKDEFTVYKNSAPLKCSQNFGEELFGLDEDSFTRTAFITASDIDGGANSDIGEKITGRVFSADGAGLKEAIDALDAKRKRLKAARGNGGEIDRKKEERRNLLYEIAGLEDTDIALTAKYHDRKKLAGEIAELEKRLEKLNEDKILAQKWATYDGSIAELNSKKKELEEITSRYKNGLPAADEIKTAEERYAIFGKNSGALENVRFLNDDRLKELEEKFSFGMPDEADFEKCTSLLDSVSKLSAEAEQISGSADSPKAKNLDDVFRHGLPDEKELENAKAVAERYGENDKKLKTSAVAPTAPKKNITPLIVGSGVSALILIAGIALLFFVQIAGIIALVLGALGLVFSGVLLLLRKSGVSSVQINTDIMQALSSDEQLLRGYLAPYGYYSDSVISSFTQFLSDLEEYKTLLKEREEKSELANSKSRQAETEEEEALAILEKYGYLGENARASLNEMRDDTAEYKLLLSQRESTEENRQKYELENKEILESITKLLNRYGLEFSGAEGLRAISDDIKNYGRLEREVREKEQKTQSYKEENGLFERAVESAEDLSEVRTLLAEKRKALGLLDSQITDDEAALESLPEKRVKKEQLDGQIKKDEVAVKILSAAKDLLSSAHQKLCDKYIAPVKDSFLKYSDAILKALGEKLVMTADFEVSFEFSGEIKSRKHLSAGQLAVCGLCLRLALLDNIFKDEKPFVIMDDPFINLDKDNMQNTAKAVKELTGSVQIIYFCCHESRKI